MSELIGPVIRCADCGELLTTTGFAEQPVYCYRHWKARQKAGPRRCADCGAPMLSFEPGRYCPACAEGVNYPEDSGSSIME